MWITGVTIGYTELSRHEIPFFARVGVLDAGMTFWMCAAGSMAGGRGTTQGAPPHRKANPGGKNNRCTPNGILCRDNSGLT